jgi:hypothetical protein
MFVNTGRDILWNMIDEKNEEETKKEIETLRVYINDQFEIIGKRFNCKTKRIDPYWHILNNK